METARTVAADQLVKNDVVLNLKIAAIKALAKQITGELPQVIDNGDYYTIKWTAAQKMLIQNYIYNSIMAAPGRLQIETMPVLFPAAFRAYGKIAISLLIAAFFIGRLTK
jgi:hypothetical protein